jgi:uncharacterized OB-fold protein
MTGMRPRPILGVYEQPFWDKIQERRLHLQRCENGHFRFPPGPACPRCLSAAFDWVAVAGRGTVVSWTVFHRQYFPEMPVPYTVICGALEEGPLVLADLGGAQDQALEAGKPLHLVYEDARTKDGDQVIYRWSLG